MNKKRSKIFALLTAYSWPKRRMNTKSTRDKLFFLKTRKVDLNSNILKNYKLVEEYTNTQISTFINNNDNEIIISIRGTDLSRIEENDLYADFQVLCGNEKNNYRYKKAYTLVKNIIDKYHPKFKISLSGSSLGARIAVDLLDSDLGKNLYEIHAFNCATSLCHLYHSTECLKNNIKKEEYCKNRKKLHIHLVNRDPISILSMGELSKTKRIYEKKISSSNLFKGKKKNIKNTHSILNFV